MQNLNTRLSVLALAVIGTLAAGSASASGFHLRENSTKNLGRAYTGSAVAKDASVVSNNPAAMVNLDRATVQGDVSGIDLTAKFEGGGRYPPSLAAPAGAPISGGNGGDPGSMQAVPAIAAVFPMHGALEGLTIGASISAPFGLKTDYDANWVGRYNATLSDVKTADLTLSAAVKVTPTLSAGLGLIYQRTEVTLGKALPLGVIAGSANPALATTPDGNFTLTGKDNSFGYVAGLQWRPTSRFAIGYSHHSEIDHKFNGVADFTTPAQYDAVRPTFAAGAANPGFPVATRQQLAVLANGFKDTNGYATLVTPAIDTLSAEFGVTERLNLYGEVQRTGWSSLKDVTVKFANPYQPTSSEAFNWKDSMYYGLGADYKLNDAFTVRAGLGFDQSPTNDTDRTPRLPDNDRNVYSAGLTWTATPNFSIDAAYTRIEIKSPSVNLPINPAAGRYTSLQGSFKGHADIIGLGASYRF